MNNIAISVEGLSKKYSIGTEYDATLRGTISSILRTKNVQQEFWALDQVSFQIKNGEAVGIIGDNGSGKSTLLKILSKITYPTKGKAEINGRVASLLEVGTGFHPELTGRENIFLNGSLLGMSKSEIKSSLNEIIEFSGVEKFIDTPVKRYSSGMFVRLAFSVAAHLRTDILLIDEILAVGDQNFQKKCLGKMGDAIKDGKTVLFVSHNLSLVNELCPTSILLDNGKLIQHSETQVILNLYDSNVQNKADLENDIFSIKNIHLDLGIFKFSIDFRSFNVKYLVSLSIYNDKGIKLIFSEHLVSSGRVVITIPTQHLKNGIYKFSIILKNDITRDILYSFSDILYMNITDKEHKYGYYDSYRTGSLVDNIIWHQ